MVRALRIGTTFVVLVVAYPVPALLSLVLAVVLVRHGVNAAVTATVLTLATAIGIRIAIPKLAHFFVSASRRWTRFVNEMWKTHQAKLELHQSEARIRASFYDSTTNRTNDLRTRDDRTS